MNMMAWIRRLNAYWAADEPPFVPPPPPITDADTLRPVLKKLARKAGTRRKGKP